ncbi:Proteophosphoglycan 5 [Rhodotorula toruloides ATCC 204091]|uniref:Proteophosphoglycan 5 n=1 Tax=Rhodotorula toruloides TaxID=5286 RepID=A0A0K3CHR2_RHOTO|nr:Proteophosphoglycan 5 [Rhodotorula toruloides ATCC 204091]KAK4331660.1 Proteophosphoglycan 5 [Rhodotorula toruloides]PRQ73163.1 Proteophosphoglycan 5 [Rhodotorula toruloides]
MRFSLALSAVVALTTSTFALASDVVGADQSPNPALHQHSKRATCFLGICWGTSIDTTSDVNNCGSTGYKCPTTWANGSGSQCVSSVCMPGTCNAGYALNTATRSCVSTQTDPNNCGSVGKVCTIAGATGNACASGVCYATSCQAGYGLVSGTCKNLATDSANCGALGNVCQFPGGTGTCNNGVCTFTSCASGYYLVNGVCTALNLQSDPNNCGSLGNKCSVANGVAGCSAGSCTVASCNAGYTQQTTYSFFGLFGSSTSCVAVNTASDVNNCGAVGKVCSFTNGAGTCSNGQCTYTSCNSGFYNVNNVCTALNLASDVNNCGSVGNKCSYPNGVASCSGGSCTLASCNAGYSMTTSYSLFGLLGSSTSCSAVNTQSDINNCGAVGNVCAFQNGQGTCSAGQCTYSSCNSGFYLVGGKCTSLNLQSDVSNCGSVGKACSFPNGQGTCSNGQCVYTSCSTGYALSSGKCTTVNTLTDINNCGKIGNVCPSSYSNGGSASCVNGQCTTTCAAGFDFDTTYNFCRDVTSDVNNCGTCGRTCTLNGAKSTICSSGKCLASACDIGYTLVNGACVVYNFQTDPKNCGSFGNVCTFTNGAGTCSAGKCLFTSCNTGYILNNGVCVLSGSQKARAKRSKVTKPKTLCPVGEQACPILGSTSYNGAVKQHFASGEDVTGVLAGSGGYECVDTKQALDSCGGCASTGEGVDCTKIRGAAGVGCQEGRCVVFSCQPGFKPSLSGDQCVRTRSHGANNSTLARRHLAARHQHGHAHAHFSS